jgi:hypothetical protein
LDFKEARDSTNINLITLANSKILTLYDDSHRLKYQKVFSYIQFNDLSAHLRSLKFKKIQGRYINANGVRFS